MKVNRKGSLSAILSEQGFGSRKDCVTMISAGWVEIRYQDSTSVPWLKKTDPNEMIEVKDLYFQIEGLILPYQKQLHLVLNKPTHTECSHSPTHHQSVFALLPAPFLKRGIETVGRLDADTTGLLLLSDVGDFNHYFTSPKRHIPKTYRVETKHPISLEQKTKLESGVELHGDDGKTLPARMVNVSEKICEITIHEGKYHQVKRMFGAVGNRVESIHRIAIGAFILEENLSPGQWRILNETDLVVLGYSGT